MEIALRFVFEGRMFFDAILPMADAEKIISDFASGVIKPRLVGKSPAGCWTVKTDKIVALHTMPLEAVAQANQAMPPQQLPSRFQLSGVSVVG